MNKRILYVVASITIGVLVAAGILFVFENIIHKVYATPQAIDLIVQKQKLKEVITAEEREFVEKFTKRGDGFMILMFMVFAYVVSSMIGGGTAAKIARTNGILKGLIVGFIFTGLCYINTRLMWHPQWFVIASLVAPVPCAIIGSSFAVYWVKEDEAAEPEMLPEEEEPLFQLTNDDDK